MAKHGHAFAGPWNWKLDRRKVQGTKSGGVALETDPARYFVPRRELRERPFSLFVFLKFTHFYMVLLYPLDLA